MIPSIIGLVIFVVSVTIVVYLDEFSCYDDKTDTVSTICTTIAIVTIAFVLLWAHIAPANYKAHNEIVYEEQDYAEIYSLETVAGVYGSFALGYGTVESEGYYFYYVNDDGYLTLHKLKAKDCKIKETNDISPCIKYVYAKEMKEANYWLNWGKGIIGRENSSYYCIYVPVGTVQQYFNGNIN